MVGSNFTIQESNLLTLEPHTDFNPVTLWLRHTCTKHTMPVRSLLTPTLHFHELFIIKLGLLKCGKTIQQRVSSWFTFYNPSSRKHAMHIRGLIFPLPHQLLFPPIIISVAITTPYSTDQPRSGPQRTRNVSNTSRGLKVRLTLQSYSGSC